MLEENALAIIKKGTYILKLLEGLQTRPIENAQPEQYIKPSIKREDVIVLIGFGSGVIAQKLLEDFPKNIVVCYETQLENLKYTFETINVSQILDNKNFMLFASNENEIENTVKASFNLFASKLNFGDLVVLVNPTMPKEKAQSIENHFKKLYTPIVLNRNTLLLKSQNIIENTLKNISDIAMGHGLGFLKDKAKGKPALIVASGPSLSYDIENIKNIRNRVVLIAVDSVVNILEQNDIVSDIICGLDYQQVTLEKYSPLMKKDKACETLFVFEPAIFYQIPKLFKNKVFKTEESSFLNLLDIQPSYDVFPINAVTHLAANVAYILGANPIIFVGQDWAYTKADHHAKGTILQQSLPDNLIWVKGNYEEKVPTDSNLFSGLTIMSEIAKFLNSKNIEVINATNGGAYIENTKLENLNSLSSRLKKTISLNLKFSKKLSLFGYIKKLKNIHIQMNKIIQSANKALSINDKISKLYAKYHDIEKVKTNIALSNKINNELYSNPILTNFVFFYYFKEFYDYFKSEVDIENQNFEQRIDASNRYFELINQYTQKSIDLIETVITYLELKDAYLKKPNEFLESKEKLFELMMQCVDIGDIYFGLEIIENMNTKDDAKLTFAKAKLLSTYRYFHKQAIDLYEQSLRLDPNFERAANELAIEKYKIISHLVLAREAITNQNDFITARRLIERAKDYDEKDPQVEKWLSVIKEAEQIQTMQAKQKVIRGQLKIEGVMPEYDEAVSLIKQNKINEAFIALENLNKKYPSFGDALFLMGSILIDKNELDKAHGVLLEAKKLIPYHPFVYIALARIYMAKEVYDKAKEALELALKLNPNLKKEIGENLGDLYYEFGEYDKALSIYESNINNTLDKVKLLMKIALCYKSLGLIQNYNQILSKIQELASDA